MTIIREMDDGFVVRIVRDRDGYDEIKTDFISHSLFDSCVRTGYLTKIEDTQKLIDELIDLTNARDEKCKRSICRSCKGI